MATTDGENAEITMYGEIVEQQPIDWWSGEPIEGEYIIESEFLKDLKAVEGTKTITIRMNSLGGNAGVSILIHNRLRELAAKGTSLVCIVDGIAMSGGSLIMCACDTVRVNPSSLVMIHKCWSFIFGGYNADELRQMADSNDAWDKAQVAIYARKSKLSETIISHMMSDTTYMTGKEAVEKGFADELLDDAEPLDIAASADGRHLFVRGREMHLAPGMMLPDSIPTVETAAQADKTNKTQPATTGGQEGGTTMANNLEELRIENPELANQLMTEAKTAVSAEAGTSAVEAERKRIEEIDAIASLYDDATVQEAKYGKNTCTAQEMAFRAAQNAAKQGKKFINDAQEDFQASGAGDVGSAPGDDEDDKPLTPEQRMAAGRADAKKIQNKEEK
ncbi:MAG: Clp protease ClpP [Vallitaleaceae bacterium]|nr:Clp protease ClpP [Vallitaleaceae bacterium]